MVDILCPHCEEEISLDDDASGEFACPYCGGEFEWNVPEPAPKTRKKKVKNTDHNPNGMFSNPIKIVNAVFCCFSIHFDSKGHMVQRIIPLVMRIMTQFDMV